MDTFLPPIIALFSFVVIALASQRIGDLLCKRGLPLISGYLLTGVIVGPYALNLITADVVTKMRFIDEMALGFIAFAAGNELYLSELKNRLKSIGWVTAGLVLSTFTLGSLAIVALGRFIPFMQGIPLSGQIGIALLGGSILVARSPSSAIAIVNELRANGPFTKTALGVTVVSDVVVIILFSINSSAANALLENLNINLGFFGLLLLELSVSIGIGYLLYQALIFILSQSWQHYLKIILTLLFAYGVFFLSNQVRTISHQYLPFEILLEPLLICMIAGFLVRSFSDYYVEFSVIIENVSPAIFILFFTLTGASLEIDILIRTWPIALILFSVRLVTIILGAFSGGMAAGDPHQHNRLSWMTFVTQAGVGLGLAKGVATEFPEWGTSFATVMISVIIINQFVGPPLFKWAIKRVGEAHMRAQPQPFDGVNDAILFGLHPESITLARRMSQNNWQVKLAYTNGSVLKEKIPPNLPVYPVDDFNVETLHALEIENADAIITFLDDDRSYDLCERIYENFGTKTMVVRLTDRSNCDIFEEFGAVVVEQQTAVVSLLEHAVLSPSSSSLMLGFDEEHVIFDIELRNPDLEHIPVRDLNIPLDVLILSIHRGKQMLVPHGYSQFQVGDIITFMGPKSKIDEVMRRFEYY